MYEDSDFEVLPADEMRKKYGLTAENRPLIKLNQANVPKPLWRLIPLAERFGISDDLIREDLIGKTPAAELKKLREAVHKHDDLFDEWLAGPEADEPPFSAEYIAFTCLRRGADF